MIGDEHVSACWLHHKDAPTVKGFMKTMEVAKDE